MRILHICDGIPPLVLGGAGGIAWDIAKGQAMQGHTVTMLTASDADMHHVQDAVEIRTIPRLPQRWAHYRSVWSRSRAEEVQRIIRETRPDVVHAHVIAWQCGYAWIRQAAADARIVVTCHDVMNIADGRIMPHEKRLWLKDMRRSRWEWNPLRTATVRSLLNTHCTVIAVSDALRTKMQEHGYTNVHIVHNGIRTDFWDADISKTSAREAIGIPQDASVFLLAGRLGVDKGTALVQAALPTSAHLMLAGGTRIPALEAFGERLHAFDKQDADGMRLLYYAADATLVPSRCLDCFPTVCLESMACATPVIATSWGGAKEAVVDGITGRVLHPLDADAWRSAMQQCMTQRDEWEQMGRAGRTRTRELFSLDTLLSTLEDLYAPQQ